jgi:hypothetical protein
MSRRDILQAAVSLQTPFVTAAAGAVLFAGLCRLGVGGAAALATALVYALGTMALPYSGSLYTQPLAALGMAWLLTAAAAGSQAWAGVALALLLVVRLEFLVLLPALWFHAWRNWRAAPPSFQWLAAGAAFGLAVNGVVNYWRGDPVILGDYGGEAFTTPLWTGLEGLLVSPGKGLVWFAPAAAAGLALVPWLWRRMPHVGLLVASLSLTLLIVVACWWTWHGARSWGPRLLVPLMPVLVLPLAWVFDDWQARTASCRWTLVTLIAASIGVQLWGTLRDPVSESVLIDPPLAVNENESIYIPQAGPWGVESQSFPDLLLWRLWQREPAWRVWVAAIAAALLGIAVVTSWCTIMSLALPAGWCRGILPQTRPRDLTLVGACVLFAASPCLLSNLLIARWTAELQPSGTPMPAQFRRMTLDESGDLLSGHLYVPLGGEYILYQHGPRPAQFYLDNEPLFRTVSDGRRPVVRDLSVGFHRFAMRPEPGGSFNALYWTTPGLAHYKEPVDRLYLTGPDVTWRDRAAIAVAHWRWAVWVVVGALVLFAISRGAQNGPTLEPSAGPELRRN